ncbi:AAA family ATPase [Pseudomonas gessardii]|uniref:AAA family ATPase n=1 Tax=Pseudomonas gessardii TaxID=78544 RepID=UPI001475A83A|nr:AAA family ATPase [Pseudomonas gessardii]NNA66199.1 AAA family ATPase [Pseudomonas gessardii]
MKINSVSIENVGGITSLNLTFNKSMNIVCGPNGVGKTTILECVAHAFVQHGSNLLKRKANSAIGLLSIETLHNDNIFLTKLEVKDFEASASNTYFNGRADHSQYLISLKTTRTIHYQSIHAISPDIEKPHHLTQQEAHGGSNIGETKGWFLHRVLWSLHPNSLSPEQLHNLECTKGFFSLLDKDIKYSRVLASTNDIMLDTPNGEIYYEYLSSGFKACLALLFSITKDIEFRFRAPNIKIDEFDGVILIDEIELHLHPAWQGQVPELLRKAFPKAQFIVTTHSPHVIQAAQPSEVIALSSIGGDVIQRPLPSTQFGFQGWTIEEVLEDVMGMSDTRTPLYHSVLAEFENAINEENYEKALSAYTKINDFLHPENHLRKLLKFQLAAIEG